MTRKILSRSATALLGVLILAASAAGIAARAEVDIKDGKYFSAGENIRRPAVVRQGGNRGNQIAHHRARRLTPAQVRHRLSRRGYTNIYAVNYASRRNLYVARGYTRNGRQFTLFVNPRSGQIVDRKFPRRHRVINRHQVIQLLQRSGYTNIRGPEYRNGIYVARAQDRSGYRRSLQIDPRSGVIRHVGRSSNRSNGWSSQWSYRR